MIVNLKFIGLEKIAAVLAVKQGCKGGYRPPNALGGGNGSFKVKKEPAKLFIHLEYPDGRTYYSDIIHYVRKLSGRKQIRETFVSELENKILSKGGFVKYDEETGKLYLEEFF